MSAKQKQLLVAVSTLAIMLIGCTSTATKVEQREDLLSASGFAIKPANTAKRQALLATLPAHHFVQRAKDGKAIFLYSDPLVCDCLYVGDDKAYGRYQSTILQRQMARDEMGDQAQLRHESRDDYNWDIKAIANEDAAWDWGPWGPGF